MTIFGLVKSAAASLRRRLVSLVRGLLETDDLDAPRRDWKEEDFVFQRRDF